MNLCVYEFVCVCIFAPSVPFPAAESEIFISFAQFQTGTCDTDVHDNGVQIAVFFLLERINTWAQVYQCNAGRNLL